MDYIASLQTLKRQWAYEQDVDIRIKEKITGGFGKTIYEGEWIKQEGSPIVVLEMKGTTANKEVILYISLDHRYIIKTYGLIKPSNPTLHINSVLLLQEYAKDGDLGRLLTDRIFIPSYSVLLEIFLQVCDAMIYLSDNGVIHGDLACRNVVVIKSHPTDPKRNLVKLIDFGLTRDESTSNDVKIEIPIRYVAQEIIRSQGRSNYSVKSDVYSFAVLLWEAFSPDKRMPFDLISDDDEVGRRKLTGEQLTRPEKCNLNIWTLMVRCWNERPEDRPDFQTIYRELKNIQKLDTSTNVSHSSLATSHPNQHVSGATNICQDCGTQYTDYESHLKFCIEQESKYGIVDKPQRRNSPQDFIETGDNLSEVSSIVSVSSSSSVKISDENLGPCEFCNNLHYINDLDIHQSNCEQNPRNRSKKSFTPQLDKKSGNQTRSSRIKTTTSRPPLSNCTSAYHSTMNIRDYSESRNHRSVDKFDKNLPYPNRTRISSSREPPLQRYASESKIFIPKNVPQLNTIQMPCEICKRLINASELDTHQRQCDANEQRRIERERMRIANEKSIEEVECIRCHRKCLITDIDNHQDTCERNPGNTFNQRSYLSLTRSNSVPDFLRSSSASPPTNISEERQAPNNERLIRNAKTKKSDEKKNNESSSIVKFVTRLFSSKKKQEI